MSANPSQVHDSTEFIPLEDYRFIGNDVTVQNKRTFIEQLRLRAAIYVAAKHTGIAKLTAYRWRESDPQFAEAWDEALEDAADVMETSTYEEALGTEEKPGNPLLKMFWLKAHRPKFRDKVQVDLNAVQSDIDELISKVNQRQLPPPMTMSDFVDTDYSQGDNLHFPIPSQLEQKEESESE